MKDRKTLGEWPVATLLSAIALLAAVNGYFFPRSEAATLEKRVDSIEARYETLFTEIRTKLDSLMNQVSNCRN